MDQGHEDKRPRLSTGWPAGPSHHGHGVSLPHPGPPLTTATHHPQPLPPPTSSQYSPSPHLAHPPPTPSQYSSSPHSAHPPHPFPRPQEFSQPHQPPPPLPPQQQQQQPQQQQQQQPPPPPPPQQQHFDERRQHEPERYPLPQDHRHHHPPSPAHQHYPSSAYQPPGRDSMVKRESDDIKLPQIVRPNSTGTGPEQSLPPPPHGHPPPVHMEERRHMSYENGPAAQLYRHPTYPPAPQTPLPHPGPPPTPYEQTQMYAPPMGPDGPYPITYAATGGKRKSQRASQACDSCRQLKAKCDENKPCKNCVDKNMPCNYRDPAPKQQDKATQDILDAVQKMLQTERREILAEIAGLKTELRDLRSDRRVGSAHSSLQGPTGTSDFVKRLPRVGSPEQMADGDETFSSISPADAPTNGIPDAEAAARRMRLLENEEETEEPPGEPIRPQEAPFPYDHTTPAGRLLKWPSIRDLVRPLLLAEGVEWIDSYPQRWEESRGQLPLFGRGEASVTRPAERDTMYDYVEIADDNSQVGDHQSPSGVTDWGPIGGMSSPGGGGLPADLRNNVSRADGSLDFDERRVWHFVGVYKNHIQNMHPLIPPGDLDAMVVSFLEEVGAKKANTRAKFANQPEGPMQSTLEYDRKRKRSPGPNGAEPGPPSKKLKPQRSVKHALVLLILALGKICNWRDRKLPEAVEKEATANHNSPVVRNGHVTSPTHGSPPSSAISQSPGQAGLPSPKDIDRSAASRRSSMQASGMQAPTSAASPAPSKKNYEVIPGLEYFAYATDILGNQFGGYKLSHVQAHILASLYYAQLGRVVPSFRHIRFACQMIVDKLQPAMARLNKLFEAQQPIQSPRDNKYLIAFWSCCQLESDILAELNLLPSGILQYESLLPVPEMVVLCNELEFSPAVVNSYLAQLWLRRRLNEISGQLYNPNYRLELPRRLKLTMEIEQDILAKKDVAGGSYAFDVNDPPAEDILHARFRAKFWGANVLTYRPYIENIMSLSHSKRHPEEYRDKAYASASVPSDVTTPSDIPPIVIQYACKGISVLFKSTEAFHGLRDRRFIITNIFGTAHAQWGNLVTLAAAYQDPVLGKHIDEGQLRYIFRKTIEFFEVVAQDSSSLAVDLKVLRGLLDALPRKDQMTCSTIPPAPNDPSFFPTGQTYHLVPGLSPHVNTNSNTPSDMGQGTPMETS